jgi:hypothetical protein
VGLRVTSIVDNAGEPAASTAAEFTVTVQRQQ